MAKPRCPICLTPLLGSPFRHPGRLQFLVVMDSSAPHGTRCVGHYDPSLGCKAGELVVGHLFPAQCVEDPLRDLVEEVGLAHE